MYTRPRPSTGSIVRAERRALLEAYFAHYSHLAKASPDALNRKVSRKAFRKLLDAVGELLLKLSAGLVKKPGPARDFLDQNPLPPVLVDRLPEEFRMFCLALNALKQWVTAEQAATDRYLLGGTARNECRAVASACVVSGETLTSNNTDLHHPVRDGRPPIPLTKKAHAQIEGQVSLVRRVDVKSSRASDNAKASGVAVYRSSRLLFKASVIEPLDDNERFRVETPNAIYEMTKSDFYRTFANAAASDSYRTNGTYSYSRVPAKAMAYRVKAM